MSLPTEDDIRRLIALAYAAAARGDWDAFLEAYRVVSDSAGATLMRWNRGTGENRLTAMVGDGSKDAAREYVQYYRHLNPHFNRYPELMVPGNVTFGHKRLSVEALMRTEYHADYLRRFDLEGVMGACLTEADGEVVQLCVLRPFRTGLYGDREERIARRLIPHARHAIQLRHRLADVRSQHSVYAAALDTLEHGVVVLDRRGRVLRVNQAAKRLFDAGVLKIDGAGLEVWDAVLTSTLRRRIRHAVAIESGALIPPPAVLHVPSPCGTSKYRVAVVPEVSHIVDGRAAEAVVTVTLSDITPRGAAALTASFKLTPRETQVAGLLLRGCGTAEIAGALDTSTETVRTHVKNVLRKTGQPRVAAFVGAWAKAAAAATPVTADRQAEWPTGS